MIITIIVLAVTSYLLVFGAFYISDDGLKFYLPPMVAALAVPTLTLGSFNVITDEKTSGTAQLGILAAAVPLSIALVVAAMWTAMFARNRVDTKRSTAAQKGLAT
jgi:4-amino-4-deoxy-L-arabinose transferase-like glycosyltransferase